MPVGIALFDSQGKIKDEVVFTHHTRIGGCGAKTTVTRKRKGTITSTYHKLVSNSILTCKGCLEDMKFRREDRDQVIMWETESK